MFLIKIEKEKILNGFKELAVFKNETHENLVKNATLEVDEKNDIEATLENNVYWIITTPLITRHNNNYDYEIRIKYEIKEKSKYNETIYDFTR